MSLPHRKAPSGFTLVELAVVVVIIGVIASFAVPRFLNSVERAKATEAFSMLDTVHSSMERYHARQATYASTIDDLDVIFSEPENFVVGLVAIPVTESSLETGWQVTLTRRGFSAGFGAYTVTFNQDGFDEVNSSIPDVINPMQTSD